MVGVPDTRLGETLAAFIVATTPRIHPPQRCCARTSANRSPDSRSPEYRYAIAELPVNAAGKVLRTELRAAHVSAR